MPISASQEFADHLQSEVLTLATIWKITRQDEEVYAFTDHDTDLNLTAAGVTFGSPATADTYVTAVGYTRSGIQSGLDLSVDNVDVLGIIDLNGITEADLRAGKFDTALVEIGMVNYEDLTMGVIYLRRGYFGEVQIKDDSYYVELRGLTDLLNREVGSIYTIECLADLGDSLCGIDIETDVTQDGYAIKFTGTVATVVSSTTFTANLGVTPLTGAFDNGLLRWTGTPDTDNLNGGRNIEVDTHTRSGSAHTFHLLLPMMQTITVGDTFTVYQGCPKNITGCSGKFGPADGRGNVANHRGFPHIGGPDKGAYPNRAQSGR